MGLKYFSVDIETTGIKPEENQIIEFGAIFEDPHRVLNFKEIPKFKRIIRHDTYVGSAIAINMNARIFDIIAKYDKLKDGTDKEEFKELHGIIEASELIPQFKEFVIECYIHYDLPIPYSGINIAGKNFAGFDAQFIKQLHNAFKVKINYVMGDPTTLYTDFYKDSVFAGLSTCKERAGFGSEVTHNALEDAWDVVRLLRKKY